MPKPILIFTLFFLSTTAHAQYGDAYHKANQELINKQQKAYTDAYIDALRKGTNGTTKSSGGTVDPKAAQDLADLFAARAGRETSTQKAARLQKEQEDYQTYLQKKAVADKASADYWKDDNERRNNILNPLNAMYKAAGIPDFEAGYLSRSHLKDQLSADREKRIYTYEINERSYRAKEAFIEFNKRSATAGFDELFYLVNDMNALGYSALMAMEKLEQRFPEKKAVLEAVGLMNTAAFWGAPSDNHYFGQYNESGKAIQQKMLDNFEKWLNKYPEAAMQVAAQANPATNPIKIWAAQAFEKKDYKKGIQLALLTLLTPKSWKYDMSRSRDAIIAIAGSIKLTKSRDLFSADDIKRIAANHEVLPRIVVEWLCDEETNRFVTAGQYRSEYLHRFKTTYWEAGYDQAMKELGMAGDGDALNVYAVGVALKKQKESPKKAIDMWKQAAAAGSAWAMFNLADATKWGIKGYDKNDLPAVAEIYKTFKPATSFDKQVFADKQYAIEQLLK
jgi:hypothetical protein